MAGQGAGAMPRIVVGVDGSEPSLAALRWAVRQAAVTGSSVEAVTAWHFPYLTTPIGWAPVTLMEGADFAGTTRKALARAVAAVVDPASTVPLEMTVAEGNPARVLLDAAKGADLLVVGSRGYGGFTEALLGSVSQHCVHHAACPVVIVR